VRRTHLEEALEPRRRESRALDTGRVPEVDVRAGELGPVGRGVDVGEPPGGARCGLLGQEDDVRVRRVVAEGMTDSSWAGVRRITVVSTPNASAIRRSSSPATLGRLLGPSRTTLPLAMYVRTFS
jgi:hypothetical protein